MTAPAARAGVVRTAVRLGLPAVLLLTILAGLAAPAVAAPAARRATLTGIRAQHDRGHDRVVFQFSGRRPARRHARYVSLSKGAAASLPAARTGGALLLVSFAEVSGRDSYGAQWRAYSLPGIVGVAYAGVKRGALSFAVVLAQREPFRVVVRSHPSRIVISVRTRYRTVTANEYFTAGEPGAATIVAVRRPLVGYVYHRPGVSAAQRRLATTASLAYRALQRLFAGPTQGELAHGLTFTTSGSTGFSRLTLSGELARVYLTGGCGTAGSTVTVADEIVPTLRQFAGVRWVKIYDPSGQTRAPGGDTNSIPACLVVASKPLPTWLGVPLAIGLLVAVGAGIVLGLVLISMSVLAAWVRKPDIISPAAYHAERVKANPVRTGQFEPDVAWPLYQLRQMRPDLARIEAERRARYRKLWKWPFNAVVWVLFLPVTAVVLVCLLVAGLTTLLVLWLLAVVTWACSAVTLAAFGGTALLLRGGERGWRELMRSEASCPRCYHVTARPAYRCPGCPRLHRDIRPGRLGLIFRRCECGTLLPTMVLRAAWRLEAVCQRCQEPLRPGSAVLRDVRIPVFGDTSAGKTRFLYAALDSLIDTARRAGLPLDFPDRESREAADVALDLIRSGKDTVKTSLSLPTALTCRLGASATGTLIHLFDAAGEAFRDAEMHDSLGFLDRSHGLVYVLDPFAVGAVRDLAAGHRADVIKLAHAAAGDPEIAYGEVVARLRDSGVEASRQRLAIVVSKTDLLGVLGLAVPEDSAAIADWLMDRGMHNLVLSARREFAEVRYFTVASLAVPPSPAASRPHDPGSPLRWLLTSRGVRLPAEPEAGGADGGDRASPSGSGPGNAGSSGAGRHGARRPGEERVDAAKVQP